MMTEQQFTDAVKRYLDMVYRIALNWFRNPADAEDAAFQHRNFNFRLPPSPAPPT